MGRQLLTTSQAAARLGLGETKTKELISTGQIRSVKIDWSRRVPEDAVDEYIARLDAEQNGELAGQPA